MKVKAAAKKAAKKQEKKASHVCPYCSKLFTNARGLNTHIGSQHKEEHAAEVARAKAAIANKLSEEEEYFCELWASDREMFGNGTQSYIEAFEVVVVNKVDPESNDNQMTYNSVRDAAHRLLTRVDILNRINEIFESRGLNDAFVDKQLEVVITQNAEFNPKVRAIQEYNKLKKRTSDKLEIEHSFAKYDEMSDEELDKAIEAGEKFYKKL